MHLFLFFLSALPAKKAERRALLRRRLPALCLVLTLLSGPLLLSACGRASGNCARDLLQAMLRREEELPAGETWYWPDSPSLRAAGTAEGGTGHAADEDFLLSAFGRADRSGKPIFWERTLIDDGAFRLSLGHSFCEWIVLHCTDRADTESVAALLLYRLDLIRRQAAEAENLGGEKSDPPDGQVAIFGHYVVLVIGNDPEGALRAAGRAAP